MKENIFYGAGEYARQNYRRWITEGLTPCCFADRDQKKHNTKIGDYNVIPLRQAIESYPNYAMYLTVSSHNYLDVYDELVRDGVEQERIKFIEPVERRLGCNVLEGSPQIMSSRIIVCCVPERSKCVSVDYDNLSEGINSYYAVADDIIKKIQVGESTACDGCVLLKDGFWKSLQIRSFMIGGDYEGDYCNFKCVYCNMPQTHYRNGRIKDGRPLLDLIHELANYFDNGAIGLNFANGELTTRHDCDEILEVVQLKQWPIHLTTNASIYKEKICNLVKSGLLSAMLVSLDAGTPETFYKVRGVNMFHKVVENLSKYASAGANIVLKYIIVDGINDNDEDIVKFVEIAAMLNVTCWLSVDIHNRTNRLSEYALVAANKLIKSCKAHGLNVYCLYENFHILDRKIIESFIC